MKKVIIITGPTASGKTAVSVELAKKINAEIISADSMQIYSEMQVGTARPFPEEMQGIPHHLMGFVSPDAHYSTAQYKADAEALIEDIEQFLGYDNTTDAVLIGAGKLGQALLGYGGFEDYGLNILAAFDAHPKRETTDEGKPIYHISELAKFCKTHKVLMGIITTPAEAAQEVADQLIAGGIKAIWNFAPTHLDVPANILVQNENMATSLAVLSVHLQAQIKEEKL